MIKGCTSILRALLLASLALALGAEAQPSPIKQRVLMPGEVIEAHAEFEAECTACHESFNKPGLTRLCLDCHDAIREDRQGKAGFHGQDPRASTQSCNTCHTDHLGRDADIINMQVDTFNHDFTRFPLEGKHRPLVCTNCHQEGTKYREAEPVCVDCHKKDDFHKGALGTECSTCHAPAGWQQRIEFDHSKTDFPLQGLHTEVACGSCHAGQRFEFKSTECVDCHRAADVHGGKNGAQCDTCHAVKGWDQIIFDHSTTQFPLQNAHGEVPCRACHTNGVVAKNNSMACYDCHKSDDVHLGRNGKQCNDCHTTVGWAKPQFNHAKETGFALTGAHQKLACTSCHAGQLNQALPRDCAGCHAGTDPHKTPEMQYCATCHVTDNWRTISRFDHDFTRFPLVGLHMIAPCESCHIGGDFSGTAMACVACHEQDDHHGKALGTQCESCHSPNGWNLWVFDHEKHTGYKLEGSHAGLACEACHAPGTDPAKTATLCGTCHAPQDIHRGNFGQNCGRCHSQRHFYELIMKDQR